MNITLSPELQKQIAEKDALVEEALSFYLDYEEGEMDGQEFRDTKAAIDEALEQDVRGEGRTAEEVFANLRAKHGISR
jgi:hypothetical protein